MTLDMVPLGEVASSFVDGPFGSNLKASEYVDSGTPIVRLQNVKENRFLFKDIKYITPDKAEELRRHDFTHGDLIITKLGAPCGVACLVPKRLGSGIIVADVMRFRGNDQVDHRFLMYAINSPSVKTQVQLRAKGATRPRVNLSDFREIKIPLPPLAEQKHIAAILDKADAIRCKRKAALDMADEFLRATFLDMFGDPVTNPKGWDVKPLGEIAQFIGGGTPSKKEPEYYSGHICWASSKDIKEEELADTIDHITEEAIGASATKLVPEGTILIVVKSKILMRMVPLTLTTQPTCFNQDIKGIQPNNIKMTHYLFRHLKTGEKKLLSLARGVNTEGLTLDHLRNLDIMHPSGDLIAHFSDIEVDLKSQRKKLVDGVIEAEALFASLSQRAFRGEL